MKIRATLAKKLGDALRIRQYVSGPNPSLSLKRAILRFFNKTCCPQVVTRVQLHLVIHNFTFLSNLLGNKSSSSLRIAREQMFGSDLSRCSIATSNAF